MADTEFGAFTDDGPWVLELGALSWMDGLARTRAELVASVHSTLMMIWFFWSFFVSFGLA